MAILAGTKLGITALATLEVTVEAIISVAKIEDLAVSFPNGLLILLLILARGLFFKAEARYSEIRDP
jgi:hypothetical protein